MSLGNLIARLREIVGRLGDESANLETTASQLNALLGKDESEAPAVCSTLLIREYFKIFRSYVEHEDALVSNRLKWNTTIQVFLFAIYGLVLEKLPFWWLILGIPLFGILVAGFSFVAVLAATRALKKLNEEWEVIADKHQEEKYLPSGLLGGGDPTAHKLGLLGPQCFPWIFVLAWILLPVGIRLSRGHF
jgi:hypothetical protein